MPRVARTASGRGTASGAERGLAVSHSACDEHHRSQATGDLPAVRVSLTYVVRTASGTQTGGRRANSTAPVLVRALQGQLWIVTTFLFSSRIRPAFSPRPIC